MSEDEFNAAVAGARQAQSGLGGVLSGLGAGNVSTPSMAPTGAANGQSINGLGGYSMPSWVTPADIQMASLLSQQAPTYGEQGPDTDGLAPKPEWLSVELPGSLKALGEPIVQPGGFGGKYLVSDGHEGELQARIARKEAANEALYAKLEATMADMRSLQRQNENWRAECHRLSAELIEAHRQLAQLMAIPANALRYGGVR